ncbi:hypothetical protein [Succinimonas sp.]|uniref:hypothetical protein n=1 Tax=Succinimonas sp. TaxID=1936151 RepID=UPI00386325FB
METTNDSQDPSQAVNDGTERTANNDRSNQSGNDNEHSDTDPAIRRAVAAAAAVGELALMGIGFATASLVQKIAEVSTASNIERQTVEGSESINVTNSDTSLDNNTVSGTENSGALAKDQVNGNEGTLDANTLDGKAISTETNALENNAGAVKTEAGALDTSSEALKIT